MGTSAFRDERAGKGMPPCSRKQVCAMPAFAVFI